MKISGVAIAAALQRLSHENDENVANDNYQHYADSSNSLKSGPGVKKENIGEIVD